MYIIASALAQFYTLRVFGQNFFVHAPSDAAICDQRQLFRFVNSDSACLFQIGNNKDHCFVLDRLKETAGVVTLHDLSLLYLYEISNTRRSDIDRLMRRTNTKLGDRWAAHWREYNIKTAANYVLFEMVGDVLDNANAVIVHSRFAANKICALYGDRYSEKLSVIPHYAPRTAFSSREKARAKLNVPPDTALIVTSGFASKAKRFDWVIACLSEIARRGYRFVWVHAGEEREAEFPLSQEIMADPQLSVRSSVTGFLLESDLDTYLTAADIVLNLRFPSVGESSGTLARAFSAGTCCIVSDTAAYAELPRDCVIHAPIFNPIPALITMVEGLIRNPEIAALYGQNAQTWAKGELSVENVAAKYAQVLDASVGSPNYSNGVAASSEGENILPRKSIIIDGSVTNWWMRVAEQVEAIRGDGKFFLTFRTSRELVEEMEDCVLAERLDGVGISMLSANTAILDGMPDNVCIEICVG